MAEEVKEVKKEKIDKEKVATIKLLLSSLFARKQKFLIVDGKTKNRFVFTNMPYERTIYYRTTPEDTICGVEINNTVAPLLYEAFPIFEKVVAEIAIQPFTASLNKCLQKDPTKWPEVKTTEDDKLFIEAPTKEGGVENVEVGRLLPPDAIDGYVSIMEDFKKFVGEPLIKDLCLPLDHLKDDVILTDMILPGKVESMFKFPVRDGISMVSFKEYLKKRGLPMNYRAIIQYKEQPNVAKIALGYDDDWIHCVSMMPGTIWFPFRMV